MTNDLIYQEKVTSNKTEALFLALTILLLILLIRRLKGGDSGILSVIFICLFILFLFYSVNYRTLIIKLTSKSLKLKFGIFTWTISLDNIEECRLDDIPVLMKMGGAGIHFMSVRKRYRASFNFLQHSRVVIALKKKQAPCEIFLFRRADRMKLYGSFGKQYLHIRPLDKSGAQAGF